MALLRDRERRQIGEQLKKLVNPVKLVYFTQELECDSCRETHELLKELGALSDRIALEVYNFQLDREQVERFHIDKIPAIVVMGEQDFGIRFYGIPSGYEFSSFLDAVLAVSQADSGLLAETRGKLRAIAQPVHLQVLVTPT